MIRFENVTYTYPFRETPAVSEISFEVKPGELVLCTGASGVRQVHPDAHHFRPCKGTERLHFVERSGNTGQAH